MPSPKTVKPIASHLRNWTLAKGGRSFDAGPFRVRSEAAGPVEHQLQVLLLASTAPRLLEIVQDLIDPTIRSSARAMIAADAHLLLKDLKAAGVE